MPVLSFCFAFTVFPTVFGYFFLFPIFPPFYEKCDGIKGGFVAKGGGRVKTPESAFFRCLLRFSQKRGKPPPGRFGCRTRRLFFRRSPENAKIPTARIESTIAVGILFCVLFPFAGSKKKQGKPVAAPPCGDSLYAKKTLNAQSRFSPFSISRRTFASAVEIVTPFPIFS